MTRAHRQVRLPERHQTRIALLTPGVTFLAICLSLVVPTPAGAQEIIIGGQMSATAGITGPVAEPNQWTPGSGVTVSPILNVYGSTSAFTSELDIQISHPDDQLTFRLQEALLTLYPSDSLTMEIGRSVPDAGAALLFSPVNYLAGLSLSGFSDDTPDLDAMSTHLSVTYVADSFYLSGALSPIPDGSTLLDTSFALGNLSYLSTVTDTIPGAPLTRSSAIGGQTIRASHGNRISGVLEAGWSGGSADLSVFAYRGLDRVPDIVGQVMTPDIPDGTYDLVVRVRESPVIAVGASVQAVAGSFMFWGDGSFTFDRSLGSTTLLSDPVGSQTWQTESVTAGALDLVAGAGAYLPFGNTLLGLEYRHGFFFSDRTDLLRTDLPGTLLGSVETTLGESFALGATTVLFVPDQSGIATVALTYSPSDELSAGLRVPLVYGSDGSLFGAFEELSGLHIDLTYRF